MDLVGVLVGSTLFGTLGEAACRSACVAAPSCDAYAFSFGAQLSFALNNADGAIAVADSINSKAAPCLLYANVTALVPSSLVNSGVLSVRYS
jgi:hypothetical protein